jgi:hypothetical protein
LLYGRKGFEKTPNHETHIAGYFGDLLRSEGFKTPRYGANRQNIAN